MGGSGGDVLGHCRGGGGGGAGGSVSETYIQLSLSERFAAATLQRGVCSYLCTDLCENGCHD